VVTDEQRRLIEEARATVARGLTPRDETEPQRNPGTLSSDRMMRWRADMEKQEREFAIARAKRQRAEDDELSNSDAWATWVSSQIAAASLHCARELATALKDELDVRDHTIAKLSAHVHRLEAELCKLTTRVIRAEMDDGHAAKAAIDLPNPLPTRRRDVN
jgi:hypothetical protein